MDFGSIIDCLDSEQFDVTREEDGALVNGRRVRIDPFTFQGSGSVQQATAKTLERLDVNTKTSEAIEVYTVCPLRTADPKQRHLADIVCVWNDNWVVRALERWPQGNYVLAVCERVGQ